MAIRANQMELKLEEATVRRLLGIKGKIVGASHQWPDTIVFLIEKQDEEAKAHN